MSKIKILGIGSPFGDDKLGWAVVDKLKEEAIISAMPTADISIACCDRPGARLLNQMQGADIVFLIDAVVSGNKIGTVYRFQNDEIASFPYSLSTHDIGIAKTLQLGKTLELLPQQIIFYGIEIGGVQLNTHLSAPVLSAIPSLVQALINEVICLKSPFPLAGQERNTL